MSRMATSWSSMRPTAWTARRPMCWVRAGRRVKVGRDHVIGECEFVMRAIVVICAISAFAPSLRAQAQPATVILVRHAEKEAEPKADPPLSAIGRARAAAVVEMLRDASVDVVYHSNRLRTFETARALGDSLKVPLVEVPLTKLDAWITDLVAR